ncbi:hypothetical protein L0F63_001489, partial [Massospora cicadina]
RRMDELHATIATSRKQLINLLRTAEEQTTNSQAKALVYHEQIAYFEALNMISKATINLLSKTTDTFRDAALAWFKEKVDAQHTSLNIITASR